MFLGVVPQCPQSVCIVNLCVFVITHGFSIDTQTPSKAWLDFSVLPWPLSPQASKQWILLFCTLQALIFLSCSFLPVFVLKWDSIFLFSFPLSASPGRLGEAACQNLTPEWTQGWGGSRYTSRPPASPKRAKSLSFSVMPFRQPSMHDYKRKHTTKEAPFQSTDGNHSVSDALSLLKHMNLRGTFKSCMLTVRLAH